MTASDPVHRMKVVVVTPNDADSALASQFLAAEGIEIAACASLASLASFAEGDIGCVLLVEESLVEPEISGFQEAIETQPPWSDLPLLLIAGQETSLSALVDRVFPESGNVTLLQRPLHPVSLVSAVNVALRARQRQLQVRDLLEQRAQALRQRDEFLAMLAHELRNPLAPIRNSVYLLGTLNVTDPIFVKARAMIEKQARHITRLVDDLVDVSRLEHGKFELRLCPVDLNQAIAAAAEACLPMTTSHRHTVILRPAAEPLHVLADPVRIEQVIGNLIVNAAKFTPAGGTIAVEAAEDHGMGRVTVEDNGIGIRQDKLDSVFDLFVQGDSTLARTSGGLGLGLTLVKRLVELHAGTVSLASEGKGKGTRIDVRFPLAPEEARAPAAGTPGKSAPVHHRVLVVEDSPDIRESLGMLISLWNHEVTFASTGPEGVSRAREFQPDVALIDIGLPGLDGYQVARQIRKSGMPWSKRIRLIALTGYGQGSDREKAIDAGFDLHMLKPVDPDRLKAVLLEMAGQGA